MQCCLNGVQISEVPKFLTAYLSETSYDIDLFNPFDATLPLIIPLQLSRVTSYSDVYYPSVAEYKNDDISKIHHTAEEPPWDPSTNVYSEREIGMINHQGQISIHATVAREPVFVSINVSYSLAHDAADVIDNDNLAAAIESQNQIIIRLIGAVRKASTDPIVLAKQWGITLEKAQRTIQATTQRGMRTKLQPSFSRRIRMNEFNLHYHRLAHPVFSDMMFASTVSRKGQQMCTSVCHRLWMS